jgi:hypothetical protein
MKLMTNNSIMVAVSLRDSLHERASPSETQTFMPAGCFVCAWMIPFEGGASLMWHTCAWVHATLLVLVIMVAFCMGLDVVIVAPEALMAARMRALLIRLKAQAHQHIRFSTRAVRALSLQNFLSTVM